MSHSHSRSPLLSVEVDNSKWLCKNTKFFLLIVIWLSRLVFFSRVLVSNSVRESNRYFLSLSLDFQNHDGTRWWCPAKYTIEFTDLPRKFVPKITIQTLHRSCPQEYEIKKCLIKYLHSTANSRKLYSALFSSLLQLKYIQSWIKTRLYPATGRTRLRVSSRVALSKEAKKKRKEKKLCAARDASCVVLLLLWNVYSLCVVCCFGFTRRLSSTWSRVSFSLMCHASHPLHRTTLRTHKKSPTCHVPEPVWELNAVAFRAFTAIREIKIDKRIASVPGSAMYSRR